MPLIDSPSAQALPIIARRGELELACATGFIVDSSPSQSHSLLITNWHVVAGRHLDTRKPIHPKASIPDNLLIRHNKKGDLGFFVDRVEPLYDEHERPLWFEHPRHGANVDVVGLPLSQLNDVQLFPMSYTSEVGHDELPEPMKWGAGEIVFIIGLPFGWKGSGDLAIWVQGAVASEPELDYKSLPRFLIDSRTRPGQSGSPAIMYRRGGGFIQLASGKPYMLHNPRTKLLGVYSGRLTTDSDLGTVWKSSLVAELAQRGAAAMNPNP